MGQASDQHRETSSHRHLRAEGGQAVSHRVPGQEEVVVIVWVVIRILYQWIY